MTEDIFLTPVLRGPVPFSHMLLQNFIRPGDVVVDATCGNGGDTVLLAMLVGDAGRVWGFDIQTSALENTEKKLRDAGVEKRVTLVSAGHEMLADYCPKGISAVVFNLGYLPNGDRSRITTLDTTLTACRQTQQLLRPGGVLVITLYPGHSGGEAEATGVEAWGAGLSPRDWHVWQIRQSNVSPTSPYVVLAQKVIRS